MTKVVLTLNAGSSSLKFAAFSVAESGALNLVASGQIQGIGATPRGAVTAAATGAKTDLVFDPSLGRVDHQAAIGAILGWLRKAGDDSSVAACFASELDL